MRIVEAAVFSYTLPLRAPLVLARGRLEQREGLLLRLLDEGGGIHWGEAAPLPGFSRESLAEAAAQLHQVCARLREAEIGVAAEATEALRGGLAPSVRCAVDMALGWDSLASAERPVEIACLLPSGEGVFGAARAAIDQGYRALKLKVGRLPVAQEVALVTALAEAMPETVTLRLDANRAWDLGTALAFCRGVGHLWGGGGRVRVAFLEEPLQDPSFLPELISETKVPVALDETLAAQDRDGLLETFLPYVAALVWKPTLSGLSRAEVLGMSERASPALPIVVSAAFESGVAIRAFAGYAAALPQPAIAGLDTYKWLARDLLRTPLPLPAPVLHLDTTRVAVDEGGLRRLSG